MKFQGRDARRVTCRDITKRKRAEEELKATEENYRQLIEQAGDGIFLVEGDGRFVVVNSAICNMLGYTREELLQLNILDTYLPGERALGERRLGEIRSGANVTFERIMRRKDGTPLLVEASARRREDGRQQAIVRDITERRRAEDALRESERKSRAIFDLSFGFIGLLTLDGVLLEVNRTALEFAGVERQDAVGRPFWETAWWNHSPEVQERLRAAVRAAAGGEMVRFEAPLRAADGAIHPVDFSLKPVRDEAGQVVLLIPEGRDIAELKRAGEEKANLQAQLHQAQKMESIGRLAGGVAHDFNNLLTVIIGYSRLLLGTLAAGDPLRDAIEEIDRAGGRAAGLTQRLLAFSRKQVLQPRVLDLNRVVEEMRPLLARLVGEDVELCVEPRAEATTICADPNQLEQVIMNLAVNSRDAMPHGGRLSIGTAVVEWDAVFAQSHPGARAGRYAVLTVADAGVGMDDETRRRIFEPFFTTKEVGKGTGLGLSMTQGVVEQSGGWIDVASEPGRGTTFTIYLPWVDDAPAGAGEPEAVPVPVPPIGEQKTVLVVEDQREVREYVAAALMAYGYRVIDADGAAEALALWERECAGIDLVLTDVVMPRMSGAELAKLMWQRRPGTKVLFMSGYKDNVIAQDGVRERGVEFIQKPFSPGQLAIRVEEMLKAPDRPARILVAGGEPGVRGFVREVLESAGYEVTEAADGERALGEARGRTGGPGDHRPDDARTGGDRDHAGTAPGGPRCGHHRSIGWAGRRVPGGGSRARRTGRAAQAARRRTAARQGSRGAEAAAVVGRTPWSARDAPVPLFAAEEPTRGSAPRATLFPAPRTGRGTAASGARWPPGRPCRSAWPHRSAGSGRRGTKRWPGAPARRKWRPPRYPRSATRACGCAPLR